MDVDERLGLVIKRAEQTLIRAKSRALADFDLTVPQYAALLAIGDTPGVPGAELARRCLVTPQTMSTILQNLTDKELVDRRNHPSIGRVQQTFLTAKGQRLLDRADRVAVEIEERLVQSLSATRRRQLRELLETCISNLE